MKRLALLLGCTFLLASPAMAITEFSKQWKSHYLKDTSADFEKLGKRTNCNICHVKDKEKKKVRNEYGEAISKYLKSKDFPKDYVKNNPAEAKKKILEGFKKAGELKSKDGKKFADKIKAEELPATDAGL